MVIFGFIFNSCLFFFIVATIFSKKWLRKGIMACAGFLHRVHILKDLAKVEKWLDRQIREYQEGAAFIRRNPKVLGKVLLVTVVQLSCQFLVPYCVYLAFGLRQYGPMDLIAVQALLNVAVVALPLPGAVGATEGSFPAGLQTLFQPNTDLARHVVEPWNQLLWICRHIRNRVLRGAFPDF
ncbi:MAG: lysylphosphatidylglycerol synthase transmembrane domain-containing protein [Clostridia bacterium]